MRNFFVFSLIFVAISDVAMATENQSNDGNIVTSKLYVDNTVATRQKAIGSGPADANNPNQENGGSGANGDVVTYTGYAGVVSSKPVYDETGSYNPTQQDALIEAKNVNAAVQNGLTRHLTCRDWANGDQNSGDCWVWQINTLDGETFVPHAN